ncbi:MAG TPA: SLC13 family permease, partial [Candidatus Kapabacteria bacterium]|nr:SLC13 family permease [Candidatus Kapabacteria bacterium]
RHELLLQLAVLGTATLASMFINDTTDVVIFLPVIMGVCKAHGLDPSRYLLWLAFGSLLGGQWTLIGTRSNIIISDFLRTETGRSFGFFDLTPVAAVVFLVCAVFLVLFGRKWLPAAAMPSETDEPLSREYLGEVTVTPGSGMVGKRLGQIDWARRSDLAVLEVIRVGERLPPSGWLTLQPEDVLVMQGAVPAISQMLQSPDFTLKEELRLDTRTLRSIDLVTVEALIGPRSDYADKTLEETNLKEDHGFTVLGISRHGVALEERPVATQLEFGDSLLLLGHITGVERLRRNPNLILLGQEPLHAVNRTKTVITLALLLFIVGTAITEVLSPAVSIPLVAVLVVLFKCIDLEGAYDAVDWQAIFTTAGMIPFGLAVEKTGAVQALSQWAVGGMQEFGPVLLLALLLVLALILTHFIDNSATAVILAPLAYEMALELGVNPYPFLIALAICISASFSTPIAHESTILVMGPGRYKFKHYLKIGGVMAILTWLITIWLTPLVWPFR